MPKYELFLIIPGTLDEHEVEQHLQEITEVVKAQAQEVEVNPLGKMRLAYPIKQIRYGYYYTIVFACEPSFARALEEKMRMRTDILRSIISHFNTNLTAAKKIMYTTNEVGVTTMMEKSEEQVKETVSRAVAQPASAPSSAKVDLKDIDQKLSEILDSDMGI